MTAPAVTETVTADLDAIREIALDVGAMKEYLFGFFEDAGPAARVGHIHNRLLAVMGIETMGDHPLSPETERVLDEMMDKEMERGSQWLDEDRDAIYSAVGRRLADQLRVFFG